jgi:hypothetical protein
MTAQEYRQLVDRLEQIQEVSIDDPINQPSSPNVASLAKSLRQATDTAMNTQTSPTQQDPAKSKREFLQFTVQWFKTLPADQQGAFLFAMIGKNDDIGGMFTKWMLQTNPTWVKNNFPGRY